MVPDREMWKILLAAKRYIGWVRLSPTMQQIHQEVTDSCSLDDKCSFKGKDYTVRQLITQMNRGSRVGLMFAEAVYKKAHNPEYGERLHWSKSLGIHNYRDAIHQVTHSR